MVSPYSLAEKREFAGDMRRKPTLAEACLWSELRGKKLGLRFQRQILVRGYIVDFYCAAAKLAIEVDGSVHDLEGQAAQDEQKERALETYGVGMLRFSNEDVLNYVTVVLTRIKSECKARIALKALSPGITDSGGGRGDNRRSKSCASLANQPPGKPPQPVNYRQPVNLVICQSWKLVQIKPAIQPMDLAALNHKFAELCRQRSLNFKVWEDNRPNSEKAWEQKYKLEQYLAQKRRAVDELERRKLLSPDRTRLVG